MESSLCHHDGIDGVCLSLPTILNRNGAERVIRPPLSGEEQAALRASAEAIPRTQQKVGLR